MIIFVRLTIFGSFQSNSVELEAEHFYDPESDSVPASSHLKRNDFF